MPRDGANIYTQPFPDVASDTTIESVVYNGFTSDVANDLNAPRPILAGGTGGATADAALTNLSAEKSLQVVTNYNSMAWMSGSFYSASSATGAPVAGHAFVGLVYLADSNNMVVEARDQNDAAVPGRKYVREKKSGVWSAWKSDSLTLTGTNEGVSGDTADMFFGLTGTAPSSAFIVNTESDVSGINALEVSKAGNMIVRDTSGQAYIYLNKSSGIGGKSSDIYGQTNGLNRWSISLASTSGEAGGESGSNFSISRYNDLGTVLDTPLAISRLTGLGVVAGNPTETLGIATKQYVDGIAYRPMRSPTGATSITIADFGTTILVNFSTAATISVAAAATLPDGFWCQLINVGAALAYVDGNGAETIDGYAIRTLGLGDSWRLFSNGSLLWTSARQGDLVKLALPMVTTNTIDFDFATGFPVDFDEFEIHNYGWQPFTDDSFAYLRIKTGAGLTVESGVGAYGFGGGFGGNGGSSSTGWGATVAPTINTLIGLTAQLAGLGTGNATGEYYSGIVKFENPNDATIFTQSFRHEGHNIGIDGASRYFWGTGYYGSTGAITGVRMGFFVTATFANSNIVRGTSFLYGIRK